MRGFEVFVKSDDVKLDKIPKIGYTCFAQLRGIKENKKLIFYNIVYDETKEYINLLVEIINKITPCSYENEQIIYTTIKGYDNNLILWNFIRNLWCIQPIRYHTKNKYIIYINSFFSTLKKIYEEDENEDPLTILLIANYKACKNVEVIRDYGFGHSNIFLHTQLKIVDKSYLFEKELITIKQLLLHDRFVR